MRSAPPLAKLTLTGWTRPVALVGAIGVAILLVICGSWDAFALRRSTEAKSKAQLPLAAVRPRRAALVLIPGGDVRIGDDTAPPDERPAFRYHAVPLLMDRTPVTVGQFRRFVADTGFVTEAERAGYSAVLDTRDGGWVRVAGANWRRPGGPNGPPAVEDHPVTQVSWHDADAFCSAYGTRLPTEFEWERAARLGQTPDGHVFKAGDSPVRGGRYAANVWEGIFPLYDSGADGYRTTSPVGAFGTAPSGLTDMAGNVWEWTASWYRPYDHLNDAFHPVATDERVQRGGSYMCDPTFCQGYRATARGRATPDSSFVHAGFRCVVEPDRVSSLAGQVMSVRTARLASSGDSDPRR